ncbi:hypothetical protein Fraau_1896 [Frateuria aurantia DSM 6220]|uniref:Uncharacterized protein n=1 Tax=Frateuria aurantia (strain ATCC 33424 / DSM 6220 / KCTC 2777 / LMG 1558 / NBRC 3245 / NCIMB 13370) TaxID=767434 RepID=H8L0W7_FRAAD|nr:hypothetical protein Fraau_1896 [Frateuria aurantia DSM 6220]
MKLSDVSLNDIRLSLTTDHPAWAGGGVMPGHGMAQLWWNA